MGNLFLFVLGIILVVTGSAITVLFWVPKLVDRNRLKGVLGSRYPLIYLVYFANGPILAILGLLMIKKFG